MLLVVSFIGCATLLMTGCPPNGPAIEQCVFSMKCDPKEEECPKTPVLRAECYQADGETVVTKEGDELESYVGTNPPDQEKLINWCKRSE